MTYFVCFQIPLLVLALLISNLPPTKSIQVHYLQYFQEARGLRETISNELQIKYLRATEIITYDDLRMRQTILYELNKNKSTHSTQVNVKILKPGCVEESNDESVKVINDNILENYDMNMIYNEAIVPLEINMESMEQSDFWDVTSQNWAALEYCIQANLYAEKSTSNILMSSVETNIFITFDLAKTPKSKEDLKNQHFNRVYSNINHDVTSCLCDNDYKCLSDNILHKNSGFQVCVMSSSFDKVILDDVKISQEGVLKFQPVKEGLTQSSGLISIVVDKFSNRLSSDNAFKKNAMAVLRTHLISSLFDDLDPAPIVIEGVAKLSARNNDQDSKSHEHKTIDDVKNATFMMLIELDASSPERGISFIDHIMIPFISTLFVLIIWIANKRRKKHFYQETAIAESKKDEFAFFDRKNQQVDGKLKQLRRKTFHESYKNDENQLSISELSMVALDGQINSSQSKTNDRHKDHIRRASSATELENLKDLSIKSIYKAEFIVELELV